MLKQKPSRLRPSHPRLSTLFGLMAKFDITGAQLAKSIGRARSTVSKSLNGWSLFDSNDMKNIQKIINQKETQRAKSKGEQPHYFSIDEIFYS